MVKFHALVWQEEDLFVAKAIEFEIVSQGDSAAEAVENLKEAVELYFEDEGIKRENLPYIVNLKLQQVKTRLNLANA